MSALDEVYEYLERNNMGNVANILRRERGTPIAHSLERVKPGAPQTEIEKKILEEIAKTKGKFHTSSKENIPENKMGVSFL